MRRILGVSAGLLALVGCEGGDGPVVNVYSHRHYEADQILFDRFQEITGIEVRVVTATADELITRALRKSIALSTARLEAGLTLLASIGSTAPFVGLFGTVWGIYHALVNISASGMATLDKVAGPVGEALIMTAFGLFVAIPAVLAYNAITRANRVELSELDAFAHDLHAWFSTGARILPLAPAQSAGTQGVPAGRQPVSGAA